MKFNNKEKYFYYLGYSNVLYDNVKKRLAQLANEYYDYVKKQKKQSWFLDILVRNCVADLMFYRTDIEIHIKKARKDKEPDAVELLSQMYEDQFSCIHLLRLHDVRFGWSVQRKIKQNAELERLAQELIDEMVEKGELIKP